MAVVLVACGAWVGEESRAHIVEKLDHMTLNVLEPAGSYYDYSELEFTPTDLCGMHAVLELAGKSCVGGRRK